MGVNSFDTGLFPMPSIASCFALGDMHLTISTSSTSAPVIEVLSSAKQLRVDIVASITPGPFFTLAVGVWAFLSGASTAGDGLRLIPLAVTSKGPPFPVGNIDETEERETEEGLGFFLLSARGNDIL